MVVKSFVKFPLAFAFSGVLAACSSGYHAAGPIGLGKPVTENQIKASCVRTCYNSHRGKQAQAEDTMGQASSTE